MDQKQFETWLSTISEWHQPVPREANGRPVVLKNIKPQTGPEIKKLTYGQDQLCEWCKEQGTCQNRKSYTLQKDPATKSNAWRWVCNTCHKIYNPITRALGSQSGMGSYYKSRGLREASPGQKLGRKPKWWNEGPGVILSNQDTDPLTRRAELLDRLEAMRTNK